MIEQVAEVERTAQLIVDTVKYMRHDDAKRWKEMAMQSAKLKRIVWAIWNTYEQ